MSVFYSFTAAPADEELMESFIDYLWNYSKISSDISLLRNEMEGIFFDDEEEEITRERLENIKNWFKKNSLNLNLFICYDDNEIKKNKRRLKFVI